MCARPCEDACRRKEVDAPIGICYLKRVASDYRGETRRETPPPPNGLTAAVIGAGVNGLTAARQLARKGYKVTIYERYPVPGGVMWTGVPEWRLPRDVIMEEVELITDLGIEIQLQHRGRQGHHAAASSPTTHDAVVISAGCQIAAGAGRPGRGSARASSPACSSWRTSTSARRMSGSASASSPSAAASPRWTASAPCCAWAPSSRS